jgi:DNA-binding transcriptional ArsR family regulator
MADHTAVPDQGAGTDASPSATPDYPLDETLELTEPAQYRALFEATRTEIVFLLLERAATTSELADVLGKPKGTVGHHLKVLEEAGLVRVVRTKRVRALEAKYYGRTARAFLFHNIGEARGASERILSKAATELAAVPAGSELARTANVRYARIPAVRAEDWKRRLEELLLEFATQPRGGEVTYAAVIGIYPTDRPRLPDDDSADDATEDERSRDDAAP